MAAASDDDAEMGNVGQDDQMEVDGLHLGGNIDGPPDAMETIDSDQVPRPTSSADPTASPEWNSDLNATHVSGHSGEAEEGHDFLGDFEDDQDANIASQDPTTFDFGITLPTFRGPYQEADPAQRTTRLCIKAITTENFKSYYGKKILGPFDQKFTAIIGPNGCGKSNTIDALLFVFGFRSTKLRAHKLPELIHNSDDHKDCTSAKVTVHFAVMKMTEGSNGESEEIEKFDVGRNINNRNKSDYFLNENRCTRHELTGKLRNYDVDLDHNRFLILQGEVEQISLMKPIAKTEHEEGMLGYLEDIIGSNRYKKPIEDFEKVISELQTEVASCDAVHHRLKKDIVNMHSLKLKAEDFLSREGNAFRLQHLLAQHRVYKTKKMLTESKEKEKTAEKKLAEFETEFSILKEKEASWKSRQSETTQNMKELKKKADSAAAECAECESKKALVQADLKSRRTALKRLENEVKKVLEKTEGEKEKRAEDTGRKEELENALNPLEEKVRVHKEMFSAAQNEVASATKEWQEKKARLEREKEELVKEQQKVRQRLDGKTLEFSSVRKDVTAVETRVVSLGERLQKAQQEKDQLTTQREIDTARLQDIRIEIEECKLKSASLQTRKSALYTLLSSKKERLNTLKETHRTASLSVTRDHAIQELMKCKVGGATGGVRGAGVVAGAGSIGGVGGIGRAGGGVGGVGGVGGLGGGGTIEGIYGRVGDLGGIDMKYAVAVSAIAGAAFDRVVVDTVHTSKLCVEHVRRSGKGKVNIIVLEVIKKNNCMRNMNAGTRFPEGLPRLFDLVTVEDAEMKAVFYYTLRDTLVAQNIDQATRVSRVFRDKVVTLDGCVCDPSGSMTGGGNPGNIEIRIGRNVVAHSPSTSASSQAEMTSLENDVTQLQSDYDRLSSDCEEMTLRLSVAQRETDVLTKRVSAGGKNLQTVLELISYLPRDLEEAEGRLKQLKTTSEEEVFLKTQIEEVKTELSDVTLKVDHLTTRIMKIDDDIWGVREEKVHVSEGKLNKWEERLKDVKKELADLTALITREDGAKAINQAAIQRKKDQIEEVKMKISELLKKEEGVETLLKTATVSASHFREELKNVQTVQRTVSAELLKVEEEVETVCNNVTEGKKVLQSVKEGGAKLEVMLKEVVLRIDVIKEEAKRRPCAQFAKEILFTELDLQGDSQTAYDALRREYKEIRHWLDKTKVNLSILPEYEVAKKKYDEQLREFRLIKSKFSAASFLQKRLKEERFLEFESSFKVIQAKLKTTYRLLTQGGDAELVSVNSLNVFGDGVEFSVRPPNKSWKNISNLSGGEKTLSSLSLIFALHHFKPTPFYIMDEIDAALDYRNVTIVGKYVKDRALDAQFIIISLRPNMYQQASRHVGIFKVKNATQVCLLPTEACKMSFPLPLPLPLPSTKKKGKVQTEEEKTKETENQVRLRFLASLFPKTSLGVKSK